MTTARGQGPVEDPSAAPMTKAFVKGLAACKSGDGFVALEKARDSKRYSINTYSKRGERRSSYDIPLIHPRKLIISKDDEMVVVLLHDGFAALALKGGNHRVWSFPDAERLFATNDGVVVQSDQGTTAMVTHDLRLKPDLMLPEVETVRWDFSTFLERRGDRSWRLFSKGRFDVAHQAGGHGVLDALWLDDCLWVAESGASLRAFDTERGSLLFEVRPSRGWHYDCLAPSVEPHEMVATATNYENGSELEIVLLNWKGGLMTTKRKVHLPIAPLHRALIDSGSTFVSGTREIYDCHSGAVIAHF